jgi:hypothetical protein
MVSHDAGHVAMPALPASATELLISTGVHSPCPMGTMSEPNPVSALHGNRYGFILMPRPSSILPSCDTGAGISTQLEKLNGIHPLDKSSSLLPLSWIKSVVKASGKVPILTDSMILLEEL